MGRHSGLYKEPPSLRDSRSYGAEGRCRFYLNHGVFDLNVSFKLSAKRIDFSVRNC